MRSSFSFELYSPSLEDHGRRMTSLHTGLGTTDTQGAQSTELHKHSFSAVEGKSMAFSILLFDTHLYLSVPQHVPIYVCCYTANLHSKEFFF